MADIDLIGRAGEIAADRDHGASELLARLLPLLGEAVVAGADRTLEVCRVVCEGQPLMAPLWNACAAAVAEHERPGRWQKARAELERAPAALVRAASGHLQSAIAGVAVPELVTLSYSNSVLQVLRALAADRVLRITCGEGRPRFEGRQMATRLADETNTEVLILTDAAVTTRLSTATAVIVGADAMSADYWINKVGTFALAAASAECGIPVYVVSTSDKALARPLAARGWPSDAHPASEVWPGAPSQVEVLNPYFERVPARLATLFLTERGAIPPEHLSELTERFTPDITLLVSHLA